MEQYEKGFQRFHAGEEVRAACHLLQVFTRVRDATCGENGPCCVKNAVAPSLVRINISGGKH